MTKRELRRKLERISRDYAKDAGRFRELVSALLNDTIDKFCKRYGNGKVGIIIGSSDELPVELNGILFSFDTISEELPKYGCPDGAVAILARFVRAGVRRVKCHCECHITGGKHVVACCSSRGFNEFIDQKLIPLKNKWVKFPRKFMGLPVYYRRTVRAVAASAYPA